MKCYCYETAIDFILCVEDVENIELEAAIGHAWFKKTDNKFLKCIPMNDVENGVTAEDKALVKENFARLGQTMFEGMLDCKWENALSLFAQICKENAIDWYIFGSISDVVRGIAIQPHDIDIFIHTKDFFRLKEIFADSVVEPFVDYRGT